MTLETVMTATDRIIPTPRTISTALDAAALRGSETMRAVKQSAALDTLRTTPTDLWVLRADDELADRVRPAETDEDAADELASDRRRTAPRPALAELVEAAELVRLIALPAEEADVEVIDLVNPTERASESTEDDATERDRPADLTVETVVVQVAVTVTGKLLPPVLVTG